MCTGPKSPYARKRFPTVLNKIVHCSQGNPEQPVHYLKQYKNAENVSVCTEPQWSLHIFSTGNYANNMA